MNAIELLNSAAKELKSYIDKENEKLKAGIASTDLDPPDYHDYQTCHELMCLADELKNKLNDTYPFAVPLQIIILDRYNGNISDFARSQGVSSSQVARWLKRDSYYIEGDVYCKISKRIKKECE